MTPQALFSLPPDLRRILLLASTFSYSLLASASTAPFAADVDYDSGALGSYPLSEYVSAPDLYAPRVNVLQKSSLCSTRKGADDAREYTFIAPRGNTAEAAPVILDDDGELVWAGNGLGVIYDFKVQRLEGEDVLTYWSGDDMVRGHGSGDYHVLDSAYHEIRSITAGNEFAGDLHEFRIVDNTALLTVYNIQPADLSSVGGPCEGEIWESIFQEIDLGSGNVLFEWHATDHFSLLDSYRSLGGAGPIGEPWDWFHINSIDKDAAGNYLISARYTHSLTYIDGRTGETLWMLGGKRNDFQDLSDGLATTFAGQHDARFHDDGTVITLFDNGADYDTHEADHSRGVMLAVNATAMTAELLAEYVNPAHTLSESQGSVQVLSSGNVLLGYGFKPAYTEFSPDGQVLCDVHFGAQTDETSGDVQSYRAYKMAWKGFPQTVPDAAVQEGDVFVSWNGATEVRTWVVKVGDDPEAVAAYEELRREHKHGFETQIALDRSRNRGRYARVLALDARDSVLGATEVLDLGELEVPWGTQVTDALTGRDGSFMGPAFIIVVAVIAALLFRRWRRSRTTEDDGGDYKLLPH